MLGQKFFQLAVDRQERAQGTSVQLLVCEDHNQLRKDKCVGYVVMPPSCFTHLKKQIVVFFSHMVVDAVTEAQLAESNAQSQCRD